ncbi:MAG: RagB/SusD family nutrient uptake outer membrane protein, partial [Bacteroidota bacterium]
TPAATVYEKIIEDLAYGKLWLKDTQSNRAIPGKASASAFLASVYLTLERWQDAFTEAEDIISKAGLYDLALEPYYRNIFHAINTDNSKEPIFVLDFRGGTGTDQGRDYLAAFTGFYGQATYYPSGGWSVMVPAQAVFDTWDNNDYRKEVCFDSEALDVQGNVIPFTQFSTLDGRNANRPHISKYTAMAGDAPLNNTSGRDSQSNYQMMRYAEVLLIAAEAAVEIGNNAKAVEYINLVRARARAANGTPSASPANISGTVTLQDVVDERRL